MREITGRVLAVRKRAGGRGEMRESPAECGRIAKYVVGRSCTTFMNPSPTLTMIHVAVFLLTLTMIHVAFSNPNPMIHVAVF